MIEFVVFPFAVAGVLYAQDKFGKKMDDRKRLEKIFENKRCGILDPKSGKVLMPEMKRKDEYSWGSEYIFRLPLGLSFEEVQSKCSNAIREGLRKDIELSFDGMLKIRAFNEQLPSLVPFRCNTEQMVRNWSVPIGVNQLETIEHDFEKISHMSLGGLTGYGKTYFVKLLITSLILKQPDHVEFELIDLKGGLSFGRFKNLKQVNAVAFDEETTLERLKILKADIDKRLAYFREKGFENAKEARYKKRTFIIVDEAAELVPKDKNDKVKKECMEILEHVARVAGQLGYRLIWCTQYPTADVLPRQIKQNCDAKVALRVGTEIASKVVLDETGAEKLPMVKGRAIYKTDKTQTIQTFLIENKMIDKLLEPYKEVKCDESKPSEKNESPGADIVVLG